MVRNKLVKKFFFFKIKKKELTISKYGTNLECHYGAGIKFYKY